MKNTNITYAVALDYVLSHADLPENIADRLVALKDAVAKRNAHSTTTSPEKKAADKVKRAEARQSFLNEMLPIVRKGMDTTPRTVKEIYERIKITFRKISLSPNCSICSLRMKSARML